MAAVEYRHQAGEGLMGAVIKSFSDYPVTITLTHAIRDDQVPAFRAIVLGEEPPTDGVMAFRFPSGRWRYVYHTYEHAAALDRPGGADVQPLSRVEAHRLSMRPCRTCRP